MVKSETARLHYTWAGGETTAFLVKNSDNTFIFVIQSDASVKIFIKQNTSFVECDKINMLNAEYKTMYQYQKNDIEFEYKLWHKSRSGRSGSFDVWFPSSYFIVPLPVYDLTRGHIAHRIINEQRGYYVFVDSEKIYIKHIKDIKKQIKVKAPVLALEATEHSITIFETLLVYMPEFHKTFIFSANKNPQLKYPDMIMYEDKDKGKVVVKRFVHASYDIECDVQKVSMQNLLNVWFGHDDLKAGTIW